jgi:hypothetical protein
MLNKPSETSYLPATLSTPKPGEFSIGSVESKAAARMLAEKRKAALIPVMCIQINNVGVLEDSENIRPYRDGEQQPLICAELNPMSMGSTPVNWMTRQELKTKQREYDEYERAGREAHETVAPPREAHSVPQQEQIAADARQKLEMKPVASTDMQHDDDEAAREAWFKAYMTSRRRPLVRPRPRRYRWPPSSFGL